MAASFADVLGTYEIVSTGGGVTLHVDLQGEDVWVEVADQHGAGEIEEIEARLDEMGWQVIDELEDPAAEPEFTATGVRRWCRMTDELIASLEDPTVPSTW